jgi:hypothetical protein
LIIFTVRQILILFIVRHNLILFIVRQILIWFIVRHNLIWFIVRHNLIWFIVRHNLIFLFNVKTQFNCLFIVKTQLDFISVFYQYSDMVSRQPSVNVYCLSGMFLENHHEEVSSLPRTYVPASVLRVVHTAVSRACLK